MKYPRLPNIIVKKEWGIILLSLLLKALDPESRKDHDDISASASAYIRNYPIDSSILDHLKQLLEDSDEEFLYNSALNYDKQENASIIVEHAKKFKPHIRDPLMIFEILSILLNAFNESFSKSDFALEIIDFLDLDAVDRKIRLPQIRKDLKEAFSFFKPDPLQWNMKKIVLLQTDPFTRPDSGMAFFKIGGEAVISSNIDNPDNLIHEFCHFIINPIVDRLSEIMDDKQKKLITEKANIKLKEDYGDWFYSLLCEELIRTYVEVFRKGEKPETEESFINKINLLEDHDFEKEYERSRNLRKRCESLDIRKLEDLKKKACIYYEKFEKNELRQMIYGIYQEYSKHENIDFQTFITTYFIEF